MEIDEAIIPTREQAACLILTWLSMLTAIRAPGVIESMQGASGSAGKAVRHTSHANVLGRVSSEGDVDATNQPADESDSSMLTSVRVRELTWSAAILLLHAQRASLLVLPF